jgi:hypothetical protein
MYGARIELDSGDICAENGPVLRLFPADIPGKPHWQWASSGSPFSKSLAATHYWKEESPQH